MHLLAPCPIDDRRAPLGRVGVVVPRWVAPEQAETQGVPFRAFTFAEALLRAGYEVLFCDQEVDLVRVDRTAELLRGLDGALAAFVWMNEQYPYHQSMNAALLVPTLKAAHPRLPVVVGGEFVAVCPPEVFDFDSPVDFYLRGYGERSAPLLLSRLREGRPPSDVPGVVYRAGGVLKFVEPESRPDFIPEYLDFYRRIDLSPYVFRGGIFGNGRPTLQFATGRGCTKRCEFCSWRDTPARVVGAAHIVRLMRDLRDRYGVRQFHNAELDFFLSKHRALELARLVPREAPDCEWFALGTPQDLVDYTDADWDALVRGGLRKLEMGAESGSPRMLKLMGKRHAPEDVERITAGLLRRGVPVMHNFLFGLPQETRQDRRETLAHIVRLHRLDPERTCMTFRYFQPVWGAPMAAEAIAAIPDPPRTLPEFLRDRPDFANESARAMPWFSADEEAEVKGLLNHYLPLLISRKSLAPRWRQRAYVALRGFAERRIASYRFGSAWDRWSYDRLVGEPLECSFVP